MADREMVESVGDCLEHGRTHHPITCSAQGWRDVPLLVLLSTCQPMHGFGWLGLA